MVNAPKNSLNTQILHLVSWPSLHLLLGSSAPQITRICALLARRPSVGMLIPVILNLPPHIVHPLLETLHTKGYIRSTCSIVLSEPSPQPKIELAPTSELSFLDSLWQHLVHNK